MRSLEQRFLHKVNKTASCWVWVGAKIGRGYGRIKIDGNTLYSHRVAYTLYKGLIPNDMHVLHSCDNPCCVRPDHLFLGTHQENMQDREIKGRGRCGFGEKHGLAKLTEKQVLEIRAKYVPRKYSMSKLSKEYKVVPSTVSHIINNKTWKLQNG